MSRPIISKKHLSIYTMQVSPRYLFLDVDDLEAHAVNEFVEVVGEFADVVFLLGFGVQDHSLNTKTVYLEPNAN